MPDSWIALQQLIVDFYERGGIVMLPLIFCSILMVTIIIERCFFLRRSKLFPYDEIEQLKTYLRHPKELHFPIPQNHPVGRILAYGLKASNNSHRFREAVGDQARRELHHLERGLVILEIIVGVAPLLGLLGTALGMIEVFQSLSSTGLERTASLSLGISQALLTTVYGLAIGIPALIAFNLLSRQVRNLGLMVEEHMFDFLHQLFPEESPETKPSAG